SLDDARAIGEQNPGLVLRTSPSLRKPLQVTYRTKKWLTMVTGVMPDYELVNNHRVVHGRFISLQDNERRSRVVILGRSVIQNLFGNADAVPLGEEIEINRTRFRVIGVLEKKGGSIFGNDQDDIVMVPLQTAMRRVLNRDYLDWVSLQCSSPEVMDLVAERVGALLRRRHRLRPPFPDNDDF